MILGQGLTVTIRSPLNLKIPDPNPQNLNPKTPKLRQIAIKISFELFFF